MCLIFSIHFSSMPIKKRGPKHKSSENNWKQIVVEINGEPIIYNLDENERLIDKMKRMKKRVFKKKKTQTNSQNNPAPNQTTSNLVNVGTNTEPDEKDQIDYIDIAVQTNDKNNDEVEQYFNSIFDKGNDNDDEFFDDPSHLYN